jgi:hypothetical protein
MGSGCLLDGNASSSVPLIDTNGDVIMADDRTVIRINYNSSTSSYPTPGTSSICMDITFATPITCGSTPGSGNTSITPGNPFSPILLSNGTMVAFATAAPGYVFAFYADDLTLIGATPEQFSCSLYSQTYSYTRRAIPWRQAIPPQIDFMSA